MYQQPSLNDQLTSALAQFGDAYVVTQNQDYKNRYEIRKKGDAETIAISLDHSLVPGAAGESLLLSSQSGRRQTAITPTLLGVYNREQKATTFQARSSMESLALSIDDAYSKKKTGDAVSADAAFKDTIRNGSEEYSIPRFSSIRTGNQLESNKIVNQVAFMSSAVYGKTPKTKDEEKEAARPISAFEKGQIEQAYQSLSSISNQKIVGGEKYKNGLADDISWNNYRGYAFAISGNLEPVPSERIVDIREGGIVTGSELELGGAPGKVGKRRSIEYGTGVFNDPYNYVNGVPEKLRPADIRGRNPQVNYAIPNVLPSTGELKPREIRTMLFSASLGVFSGGGLQYQNKNDVNPDLFLSTSVKSQEIEVGNAYNFGHEDDTLKINDIVGKRMLGGKSGTTIGERIMPGFDEPQPVRLGGSPSDFVVNDVSMSIPGYVHEATGKFVNAPGAGVTTTHELAKVWESRTGIRTHVNPNATTKAFMEVGGGYDAPGDVKMRDMKFGTIVTGQSQDMKVGGTNIPISYATAEVKGDAAVRGFYETMSYEQTRAFMRQNAANTGNEADKNFASWFSKKYKTGEGEPLKRWKLGDLSKQYNKMAGTDLSGPQLANQMFQNVILKTDENNTALQESNWKNYGAAMLPSGSQIGVGVVSPSNMQSIRNDEREAFMMTNKGGTEEQFNKYFDSRWQQGETPKGAAYPEYFHTLSDRSMVMKEAINHSTEWNYNPRINPALRETLSRNFPEFARGIGADAENTQSTSASGAYAQNLRSAIAWETSSVKGELDSDNMPAMYHTVTPDQARDMRNISRDTSIPAEERLNQMQGLFGEGHQPLYFPENQAFLPAPGAMQGAVYKSGTKEFAGLARPYFSAVDKLSNMEANPSEIGSGDAVAGLNAQAEFFKKSSDLLSAGGETSKSALSAKTEAGLSGGYRLGLAMESHQMGAMPNLVDSMVRRMGIKNEGLVQKLSRGAQKMDDIFGAVVRHPQTSGRSSVFGMQMVLGDAMEKIYGPERWAAIKEDPRNTSNYLQPLAFAKASFGDWDVDKVLSAVGMKVGEGGKFLEKTDTSELQANLLTNERAQEVQRAIMPDENMRRGADSGIQGAIDAQAGKNPIEKAIGARKNYRSDIVKKEFMSMRQSKTLGMGIGYNLRQPLLASMAAFGSNNEQIERTMNAMPAAYQPALDFALPESQASGVELAKMMSTMNFQMGENGPELKGTGYAFDGGGKKPRNAVATPDDLYPMLSTLADVAARPIETKWSDKTNLFGPEGLAGMFGINPEHQEQLTKQLSATEFGDERSKILGTYLKSLSTEQQYQVPMAQAAMVRAGSKAVNKVDIFTGQETGMPGANEAYEAFRQQGPAEFGPKIESAVTMYDVLNRWKPGVQGTSATRIQGALKHLTGYAGQFMSNMAARFGIRNPTSDAETINERLLGVTAPSVEMQRDARAMAADASSALGREMNIPSQSAPNDAEIDKWLTRSQQKEDSLLSGNYKDDPNVSLMTGTGKSDGPGGGPPNGPPNNPPNDPPNDPSDDDGKKPGKLRGLLNRVTRGKVDDEKPVQSGFQSAFPGYLPPTATQGNARVEANYDRLASAKPEAMKLNLQLEKTLEGLGYNLQDTPIHEAISQAMQTDPGGFKTALGPDLNRMIELGKERDFSSKTVGGKYLEASKYKPGSEEHSRIIDSLRIRDEHTVSGQNPLYNMSQISQVFSKSDAKPTIKTPEEAIDKLNQLYEKQTDLVSKLADAHGKEAKNIKEELGSTEREIKRTYTGVQLSAVDQEISGYREQILRGGSVPVETFNKLKKAEDNKKKLESQSMEEQEPDDKGPGGFFRKTFGGFGMMYMGSIARIATQGLGQGMQERSKLEDDIAAGSNALFGSRDIAYNQTRQLENATALNGTNNNPLTQLQMMKLSNPLIQSGVSAAEAGLGAFAGASWMANNIGGEAGKKLQGAAGWIGLGTAAVSSVLDIGSRAQDPNGVGYRLGQQNGSIGGLPDFLAQTVMGLTNPSDFKQSVTAQMAYEQTTAGSRAGDSMSAIMSRKNFTAGFGNQMYKFDATDQDYFTSGVKDLMTRNPNTTQEAAVRTQQLRMRNKERDFSEEEQTKLLADYQTGTSSEDLASSMLAVTGGAPGNIYKMRDQLLLGQKQQGPVLPGQTLQSTGLLDQNLSEEQRTRLSSGIKAAGDLSPFALSTIPGIGTSQNLGQMEKFFEKLSTMVNTPSMGVYQSQLNTWQTRSAAGMTNAPAPTPYDLDPKMTLEQAQDETSKQGALQAQASSRMNAASALRARAYAMGDYDRGDKEADFYKKIPVGQENFFNQMYAGNPMAIAAIAQQTGTDLRQGPGLKTIDGREINGQYAAYTDTGMNGNITGMKWGTSSFAFAGGDSGFETSQKIWGDDWQTSGKFSAGAIGAGVNGFQLDKEMVLPDGSKLSSVGGQMGMQLYQAQQNRDFTMAQLDLSQRGLDLSQGYQKSQWGIQDQERGLNNEQANWGFDFRQRQMDFSNQSWHDNFAINMTQTNMQRGWAKDDWQTQDQTRNLQWGWQQEDFQENARFTTGRQRKIAEKQEKRATIMHDIEGDQIEKQRDRQQELWKLEDVRFALDLSQHNQQMKFQQEQLDKDKEFYEKHKKLEDEKIKLDRQYQTEQMKLQQDGINLQRQQTEAALTFSKTMAQMDIYMQHVNGQMNTLTADSLEKMLGKITNIVDQLMRLQEWKLGTGTAPTVPGAPPTVPPIGGGTSGESVPVGPSNRGFARRTSAISSVSESANVGQFMSEGGVMPLGGAAGGVSSTRQPIMIYLGNELLKTYVVDTVTNEVLNG